MITAPKNTYKIPLRFLLIVPFVLQTVCAVGLVGYLSFKSGQQAVEKLADKLMMETSIRIEQHLNNYLGKAQEINQINVKAYESGALDLTDFKALGKYFYQQMSLFDFSYVNFANKDQSFIGAGFTATGAEIGEILPSAPDKFISYLYSFTTLLIINPLKSMIDL